MAGTQADLSVVEVSASGCPSFDKIRVGSGDSASLARPVILQRFLLGRLTDNCEISNHLIDHLHSP